MPDLKSDLLNLIKVHHQGIGNVITFSILKNVFHQRDDRQLRQITKELIHEGHRIITCSRGVYFATSDRDVIFYRRNIEKRIFAMFRDLRDSDNLLTKGQMELFG